MSEEKKVYINTSFFNPSGLLAPCSVSSEYSDAIIGDTKGYDVTIDRFNIHRAVLPIYKNTEPLVVACAIRPNGAEAARQVDMSAHIDSSGFCYALDKLVLAVQTALQSSATGLGYSGANLPKFTCKTNTGYYTLTVPANCPYRVFFYGKLFRLFNSLPYINNVATETRFEVGIDPTDTVITSARPFDGSPVDKLIFVPSRMNTVPEYIEPDRAGRKLDAPILTDYLINGRYFEMLNDISFLTEGVYRKHNFTSGILKSIGLDVRFTCFDSTIVTYPLMLMEGGSVSIKLLFELNT
jgi:hypothetical protein